MSRVGALLLLSLLGVGCGKKVDAHERFAFDEDEESFDPDATEVPMTVDFAQAASRRVKPSNYREELLRIERELKFEHKTR